MCVESVNCYTREFDKCCAIYEHRSVREKQSLLLSPKSFASVIFTIRGDNYLVCKASTCNYINWIYSFRMFAKGKQSKTRQKRVRLGKNASRCVGFNCGLFCLVIDSVYSCKKMAAANSIFLDDASCQERFSRRARFNRRFVEREREKDFFRPPASVKAFCFSIFGFSEANNDISALLLLLLVLVYV